MVKNKIEWKQKCNKCGEYFLNRHIQKKMCEKCREKFFGDKK